MKHEVAKVEFFRVPRGSCKMHPNFDLAIPYIWDGEYRDDVRNLIVNVLKSGCTEFSWKLVAEFVEEREIHPKTLPGYGLLDEQKEMLTPGWFAEALRCIVSADHPLFYPSAIVAITKPYYVR